MTLREMFVTDLDEDEAALWGIGGIFGSHYHWEPSRLNRQYSNKNGWLNIHLYILSW